MPGPPEQERPGQRLYEPGSSEAEAVVAKGATTQEDLHQRHGSQDHSTSKLRADSEPVKRYFNDVALEQLEAEARERIMSRRHIPLTEQLIENIVDLTHAGNYPAQAAAAYGVPVTTFVKWVNHGRQCWEHPEDTAWVTEHDPYGLRVELYLACAEAEAVWEVNTVAHFVDRANDAKQGDWKPMMTHLQRRKPERWDARGRVFEEAGAVSQESRARALSHDRARDAR